MKSKPWVHSIPGSIPLSLSPAKNSCSYGHFDLLLDNTPSVAPPPPFLLSLSQTLVSLCRCSEVARRKHSWGSQCSPVSECLRGNLFRSREGRKDGGVEYQFCFSLLGQFTICRICLKQRRKGKKFGLGMFTSFPFFLFLLKCRPRERAIWIFLDLRQNQYQYMDHIQWPQTERREYI